MSLLKNMAVLSILTVSALTASTGTAQAHHREQACVVIQNPTDNALHYQFRWGGGEWVSYTLQPHNNMTHWLEMNNDGTAPTPNIRFDNAHGHIREYTLEFFATRHPNQFTGKAYEFQYTHNGSRLNLFAK